jgi:hypothetical protein
MLLMQTRLLVLGVLSSFSVLMSSAAYSQTVAAPAAALPAVASPVITNGAWPEKWAQVTFTDAQAARHTYVFNEPLQAKEWADVNEKMATLLGMAKLNVSPEYVSYRMGAVALMGPADYATDVQSLPNGSSAQLPWVTLVQPRDATETNCMTLAVVGGKVQGCGDSWQGGLTQDKMACFQGKTYVKCQLQCIEQIYKKPLATTPGACPAP